MFYEICLKPGKGKYFLLLIDIYFYSIPTSTNLFQGDNCCLLMPEWMKVGRNNKQK